MTTASILALVESIERRGDDVPAALAFQSAFTRKGREAHAAGGSATLEIRDDASRVKNQAAVAALQALAEGA